MIVPLMTITAIVLFGALFVLLPLAMHALQRHSRKRVLACPESGGLAEVDIDAPRAALSAVAGRALLKVKNCTLWPERKGCQEECLRPSKTRPL